MASTSTTTTTDSHKMAPLEIISQPLTLPCGLTLPNRLVKCPMQETLAAPPFFDPPMESFRNLYTKWAEARYGLLITGQVQIDRRFLSISGDVCTHEHSQDADVLAKWREWATIAQKDGTPCIVQLAHPGRMSPAGAGIRPADMRPPCPSEVPVQLSDSWWERKATEKILGVPKAMSIEEIDEVVAMFVRGAEVARDAGFSGCQIHGAHGFLVSQFLSPHTNRRTDEYGGSPEKRLKLLQRLVKEIRAVCPPPFCLSVKLNSADYMAAGKGLEVDEGLAQVRWLRECGMVDFVEISGGNAEQKSSGLHNSFGKRTISKAPQVWESTRIRESFFTEFAEKVKEMESDVPLQLSGGFRSRTGMADAIHTGACDLIGLGRAAVLEPDLPSKILLNPARDDDGSVAMSHKVRGQWLSKCFPIKIVGGGLPIQFFYYNMRRLGAGFNSDPDISIPGVVLMNVWNAVKTGLASRIQGILSHWTAGGRVKVE